MRMPIRRARWAAAAAVVLLTVLASHAGVSFPAHADTTNMAVIACENLAPYVDGDPLDVTTSADLYLACAQPLPASGALSVATLATTVGDADATLEYSDLLSIDLLDDNRIPDSCTYDAVVTNAIKSADGCTLLVFVFVDDEAPVTLDAPQTLASIETGGDVVCATEGAGFANDNDCSDAIAGNGDGVVVLHLLNKDASEPETMFIYAVQEAVEQSARINVLSLTRNDPNGDFDNDGVPYPTDNCPFIANPDQANSDNTPIATTGVAALDASIPNGDGFGDVCDPDDDNDGLQDGVEAALGVSAPPGGGMTCNYAYYPGGTNAQLADTDGDRALDGAECRFQSDPTDPLSLPLVFDTDFDNDGLPDVIETAVGSNPNAVDSDDDGIPDGVEFKGYNTSPIITDTDGDGCSDGAEIASVDGSSAVNSIDLQLVAKSFLIPARPAHDINKDGAINSIDLQIVAKQFAPAPCD